MISCSKPFSIKVASAFPPPDYYWKLDSLGAGISPPSVGTVNLNANITCALDPTGLISPNCISLATVLPNFATLQTTRGDINFWQMPSGFTIRFWARCSGADTIGDIQHSTGPAFNTGIGTRLGQWGGWATDDVTFNTIYAVDDTTLDDLWHRCVFKVDRTTNTIFWKLDTRPTIQAVAPNGLYFLSTPIFVTFLGLGLAVNRNLRMCELGIWKNVLLTEDHLTYDWNGGAGRTFP